MDLLRRLQRGSLWVAGVAAVLVLLAAAGRGPLPALGGAWLWALHPLVLALGAVAGLLTAARHRQIDQRRWEIVQDSSLTKGERRWAHQDAESERKKAAATFLAAPVLVAGWLSSHFHHYEPSLVDELLPMTSLLGFGLGLVWAHWHSRRASGA